MVQAPVYSWTGCYAGLNAGAAWTRVDQNLTVPAPVNANFELGGRETGFTGGGQVGCNWQNAQNWVFGLEGDFNYLSAKRSGSFSFAGEDTAGHMESRLRWFATLRGRFGVTLSPTLIYVTGGAAFGDVTSSVSATGTGEVYAGSYSAIRTGWTVGGGVEHSIDPRWTAKLEYLYYDLGSFSFNVDRVSGTATNVPATWFANGKIDGHILRLGINYRFSP